MRTRVIWLGVLALFIAACGSIAEPRATFEPTAAGQAIVNVPDEEEIEDVLEDIDDLEEELDVDEEEEVVVAVEPTEVPLPDPTLEPTLEPTIEPTAVPVVEEEVEEDSEPEVLSIEIDGVTGFSDFGETWFNTLANSETAQLCSTCHMVDERRPATGPYLYGIATVAGDRVEGQDATTYLYNSIVDPNSHIAPPQFDADGNEVTWSEGVMPQNWESDLQDSQIVDLVAYLLTLDQPLED